MDRKRQKLTPEKSDVQKECQDAKITDLERKLEHMENKLKLVIAELEQVKEERARDKINFEAEKCELESENEKLQSENKRLQKSLQDLESANINAEEKSRINLYNTGLNSQITKVNALNINSLPNEIILKVFSYLKQNQLGQIARFVYIRTTKMASKFLQRNLEFYRHLYLIVCKRWNVFTKSPVLWRKVNVKIFSSVGEKNAKERRNVAKSFINGLPSCVTFIRLDFSECGSLDFEKLCVKLHQNCPHVEELILFGLKTSYLLLELINFCTQFLQRVKKLVFHECSFFNCSRTVELNNNSKIEVLDLYRCYFPSSIKTQFSKLLYMKELRLHATYVNDTWFEDDTSFLNQLHVLDLGVTRITANTFLAIQRHCHNLKELYLCWFKKYGFPRWASLKDHHLTFTGSVLPHLKTICLSDSYVTCEGVVSLIQSCPSLENVYVAECVAVSFAAHPFVLANRCKSGIVKAIDTFHNHNVDYSHN